MLRNLPPISDGHTTAPIEASRSSMCKIDVCEIARLPSRQVQVTDKGIKREVAQRTES